MLYNHTVYVAFCGTSVYIFTYWHVPAASRPSGAVCRCTGSVPARISNLAQAFRSSLVRSATGHIPVLACDRWSRLMVPRVYRLLSHDSGVWSGSDVIAAAISRPIMYPSIEGYDIMRIVREETNESTSVSCAAQRMYVHDRRYRPVITHNSNAGYTPTVPDQFRKPLSSGFASFHAWMTVSRVNLSQQSR